ncbi:MAG TPA: nuclear transport factor 2 family protein [Chloroflexota bacterium]|nr:nuclear transport factor 2 family protein [Chloroflexota bacterium]HUM67239.1 nuclear transport factor 2 family protein [Chloroflexota bacterium]
MKKILSVIVLVVLASSAVWLIRQRGAEERAIRQFMDEAQAATLAGLNRRNPDALDMYFATEAEGAQAAGLAETQQAYKDFVAQLPANNTLQFHSFTISGLEVHEEAGLARVTYRLHFSVVRGGTAVYSAQATQNLALLKTPRGWRISGGDPPQLENVTGAWPPR